MRVTGRRLNAEWKVGAAHALYRSDGKWYHVLDHFPGALFDQSGYVVFETEQAYMTCSGVKISRQSNSTHVPAGIASLPTYVRVV